MRTLFFFLILSFFSGPILAFQTPQTTAPDTIILDFGDKKKVLILVNSQKDLEELRGYDLNKMIHDLNLSSDTLEQVIRVVRIKNVKENVVIDSVLIAKPDTYGIDPNDSISQDTGEMVTINIGRISIKFRKQGNTIDIEQPDEARRTRTSINLDLGKNNYLSNGRFPDEDDAIYTVKPLGSWYVGLNSIRKTNISGPIFIEWGGGINWYNFKFQDSRARIEKLQNQVIFYEEVEEVVPIRSKLTASYINLNFVPLLDFGYNRTTAKEFNSESSISKGFRIGLGGYAGYRLGSKAKYVYSDEGSKRKLKERDNFYLNNWRYGLRFQIGYRSIDLFANYDLNDLFIENRGPALNAFSFGIIL